MTGTGGANGHGSADEPDEPDEPIEPTLADLLDDLAGEFPNVERRATGTGTEFAVGTQAFARLHGRTAEFRLRPEIVAAAARTGDAVVSPSGTEWITFTPRTFDQYALDRAQAWFELGHRLATESARRPDGG